MFFDDCREFKCIKSELFVAIDRSYSKGSFHRCHPWLIQNFYFTLIILIKLFVILSIIFLSYYLIVLAKQQRPSVHNGKYRSKHIRHETTYERIINSTFHRSLSVEQAMVISIDFSFQFLKPFILCWIIQGKHEYKISSPVSL